MDLTKKARIVSLDAGSAGHAENHGVKMAHTRHHNDDTARQCRIATIFDALQSFLNGFQVDHEEAFQGNRDALLFVCFSLENVVVSERC